MSRIDTWRNSFSGGNESTDSESCQICNNLKRGSSHLKGHY